MTWAAEIRDFFQYAVCKERECEARTTHRMCNE